MQNTATDKLFIGKNKTKFGRLCNLKNEISSRIYCVRPDQLKYARILIYSIVKFGKLYTASHLFRDHGNGRSRTDNPSSEQRRLPDISITMTLSWTLSNTTGIVLLRHKRQIPLAGKKPSDFFLMKQ